MTQPLTSPSAQSEPDSAPFTVSSMGFHDMVVPLLRAIAFNPATDQQRIEAVCRALDAESSVESLSGKKAAEVCGRLSKLAHGYGEIQTRQDVLGLKYKEILRLASELEPAEDRDFKLPKFTRDATEEVREAQAQPISEIASQAIRLIENIFKEGGFRHSRHDLFRICRSSKSYDSEAWAKRHLIGRIKDLDADPSKEDLQRMIPDLEWFYRGLNLSPVEDKTGTPRSSTPNPDSQESPVVPHQSEAQASQADTHLKNLDQRAVACFEILGSFIESGVFEEKEGEILALFGINVKPRKVETSIRYVLNQLDSYANGGQAFNDRLQSVYEGLNFLDLRARVQLKQASQEEIAATPQEIATPQPQVSTARAPTDHLSAAIEANLRAILGNKDLITPQGAPFLAAVLATISPDPNAVAEVIWAKWEELKSTLTPAEKAARSHKLAEALVGLTTSF